MTQKSETNVFMKLRSAQEQLRGSLFFVPMLFIVGAVAVGEVALAVDARIESVPDPLTATVDSARQVLSVVAGATLSFAGIAFSVSLLLISLASSQFSPRVARGFFHDPFNKRVMGVVVGTFTYCLIVLRNVRGPLEKSGEPVVPSISILLAMVFGLVSILAIVAFISHSAHSMDISNILHRVTDQALAGLADSDTTAEDERDDGGDDGGEAIQAPSGAGFCVTFEDHGWIQQIDHRALLESLEPTSTMRLETGPGRYAITGTAICTIWPPPEDEDLARVAARGAVTVGRSRTMQQDVTLGVRQLADVALKALSPGVNDPTTAQDALFHLGTVLREVVVRVLSERQAIRDGRRHLLLPQNVTAAEVVGIAFDEVRLAAAGAPTVQIYLLELLRLLIDSFDPHTHAEAVSALRRQADLTLDVSRLDELPEADLERVRSAHYGRFLA